MAKKESSLKNMIVALGMIALGASSVVGLVYALTLQPIADMNAEIQRNAIIQVLPDLTAEVGDAVEIRLDGKPEPFELYPATKDGQFIGVAIKTYSYEAYAGKIGIMLGINAEGNISNYAVLETEETPGLGAKMEDWFKTGGGKTNVLGKNPQTTQLKVSKDGGDIDAITASTITSRAFLEAVLFAFEVLDKYNEQKTGEEK